MQQGGASPPEPPLRQELAHIARVRVEIGASILADVCLLILIVPPLAVLEWARGYFGLHGINAWFVVTLEAILAASTLVIVLLLVARDIRLAYRRLRLPPEEGHDDRP